eukprot:TRINITY_DN1737_c0_g2_i5.p2 TRINITY_DN1737_c0_g2~~TRINITY_DN1737_c0_g2_i5.p2  ORF type:complete len:137 (+),score=23.45 TRINITY_DN1737_c0_g2_i5:261-671(+)
MMEANRTFLKSSVLSTDVVGFKEQERQNKETVQPDKWTRIDKKKLEFKTIHDQIREKKENESKKLHQQKKEHEERNFNFLNDDYFPVENFNEDDFNYFQYFGQKKLEGEATWKFLREEDAKRFKLTSSRAQIKHFV